MAYEIDDTQYWGEKCTRVIVLIEETLLASLAVLPCSFSVYFPTPMPHGSSLIVQTKITNALYL